MASRRSGKRTNHIIGFDVGYRQQRQSERPDDRVDLVYLGTQLVRHGRAIRLIGAVKPVAKGFTGRIEHDRKIRRIVFTHESA